MFERSSFMLHISALLALIGAALMRMWDKVLLFFTRVPEDENGKRPAATAAQQAHARDLYTGQWPPESQYGARINSSDLRAERQASTA